MTKLPNPETMRPRHPVCRQRLLEWGRWRRGVKPRRARGFVLITTMFVVTGLLGLTALGITRTVTELSATTRSVAAHQAFHAAEAAVDTAIVEFVSGGGDFKIGQGQGGEGWSNVNNSPVFIHLSCDTGGNCREKTITLPGGASAPTATVRVIDINGTTPIIRTTGSAGGVQRGLEVVVGIPPPQGGGTYGGVFGRTKIEVKDPGLMADLYDSCAGPYNPDPTDPDYNRIMNETFPGQPEYPDADVFRTDSDGHGGTIKFKDGTDAEIWGDVSVGPDAGGPAAVINGTYTRRSGNEEVASEALDPPPLDPWDPPCALLDKTLDNEELPLTAAGSPYCYENLTAKGSSTIRTKDGGEVVVYIGNKLFLRDSSSITGDTKVRFIFQGGPGIETPTSGTISIQDDPTMLRMDWVGNLSNTKLMPTDGTFKFYGLIYQPGANTIVHIQPGVGAEFFGGIVANTVFMDAPDVQFHGDKALMNENGCDPDGGPISGTPIVQYWGSKSYP